MKLFILILLLVLGIIMIGIGLICLLEYLIKQWSK